MRIKMIILRILLFHITFLFTLINCDLTTKERIELHKAWLARRSGLRTYPPIKNETAVNRITYLRKLIKFNKNTNEPLSENDISYVPHNLNKEFDAPPIVSSTETMEEGTSTTPLYRQQTTEELSNAIEPIDVETTTVQVRNFNERTRTTSTEELEVTSTEGSTMRNLKSSETEGVLHSSTEPSTFRTKSRERTSTETSSTEKSPPTSTYSSQTSTVKITTEPPIKAEDVVVKSVFTSWTTWSSCSRSCGGGVKSQSRKCVKRTYVNGKKITGIKAIQSNECIGIYKRYHICNDHECPSNATDFREEQCKSFNNQLFGGKRYLWEAYLKEDVECELNCKPIGMKYFATLNKTVIDGTECMKPSEYFRRRDNGKAICVEGICKAVHNSGVISGQFMNNGAVKCGTQICRPITGIFTKNPLRNGYVNNIATIPSGASNISITELKNSPNFLVLKSMDNRYIINGDYTVSLSGLYEAAGTVFDYRRLDGLTNTSSQGGGGGERQIEGVTEWITCTGPTIEPVHLMVLAQQHNPGIKYEYLIPIQPAAMTNSEEENAGDYTSGEAEPPGKGNLKSGDSVTPKPVLKRRRFLWKVVGFSQCSKTCGGGTQSAIVKCVRESPLRVFNPKRCAHLKHPMLNENQMKCNTQPCPAYWKLSEWTDCKCGEHNEEEYRSREVKCVQELMSGIVIQVKHAACIEDEPDSRERCDCVKAPEKNRSRKPGAVINRAHNDMGQSKIGKGRQRIQEVKKHGSWITSAWSEECSAVCGMGVQYRSIFCERNASPNAERCDLRLTPDTTRECSSDEKCAFGEWFMGPWSKCSGDCFNLTKARSIVCIKDDGFAADEDCNPDERPAAVEKCQMHEVDYCRPRWHYSDWNDCTKKCGGGTQRRIVKCIEPNESEGHMKESNNCRYSEREIAYRTCNEEKCREVSSTTTPDPYYDPRVDMIQNDSNCIDDFPNCHLVVKAKLCDYKYYLDHCCSSCRIKTNELY